MKSHKRKHPVLMLVVVLALGVLLGACGTDSPTGNTVQTVGGVATVGTPTAGLNTCVSCHESITTDWMLTKHANVEPIGNLYSAGNPTLGQIAGCTKNCHDATGDGAGNEFANGVTGNVARPVVGCESCHSGGQMHADQGGAGPIGFATTTAVVIGTTSTLQVSAQFRTCTGCHELLDPNDPKSTTTSTTAIHTSQTPIGNSYVITDTHFATPGDWSGAGGASVKNITGYAMDYASERVCTNCHNPHKAPDQNREWAQSAHGDKNALPTDYWSGAWAHYDWSSRAACQRCHTTTGFAAYADALRTGDQARASGINAGTIKVLATATTPSWKPEMLQCWGCHTDNKGSLRNPGQRTADYGYISSGKTFAVAFHTYPDIAASNVCLACHTGRESGDTVMGLNNAALLSTGTITSFDFSNNGFINSHYLTGGGTVFTATGFEFLNRGYDNLSSYRHDQLGTTALPFSGAGGPCVGCHMSRPGGNGDHLFMPVTRSMTSIGHIDGIASEVCIYCHTVSGAGGLEDLINERKEEYIEAVEAAIFIVDKRGFYFRGANPYFFKKRTSTGSVASIAGATVTGAGTTWLASGVTSTSGTGPNNCSLGPDYFKMDNDGTYYKITAVADTSLTLNAAYTGTVVAGDYTIIKSGSCSTQVVRNWLTQAGTGNTPAAATDTDKTGNTTGRYNMGAAFNLNLLEHEPGAYVHNRMYAKRLLYDALDWADDNLMNYSTGTTLNTVQINGVDPFWKAGAIKYLLPYGVLGIPAERP